MKVGEVFLAPLGNDPGGATLILAITVRGAEERMVARAGKPWGAAYNLLSGSNQEVT